MPEVTSNKPVSIREFYRNPAESLAQTSNANLLDIVISTRLVGAIGGAATAMGFFKFFQSLSEKGVGVDTYVSGIGSVGLCAILSNIMLVKIAATQILRERGVDTSKPLDPT